MACLNHLVFLCVVESCLFHFSFWASGRFNIWRKDTCFETIRLASQIRTRLKWSDECRVWGKPSLRRTEKNTNTLQALIKQKEMMASAPLVTLQVLSENRREQPNWLQIQHLVLDNAWGDRTLEGEDSAGADSGRRRGGTGGGTGGSSVLLWKLTMEDTDDDPEKRR